MTEKNKSQDGDGNLFQTMDIGSGLPLDDAPLSFTDTAAVSTSVIGSDLVLLTATVNCHVAFGPSPTAVVDIHFYLPAFTPIVFTVNPIHKVSVVREATETGTGKLYIHPAL